MGKASNRLHASGRFFTARRPIPGYMMKGAALVGHTATGAPLVAMPGSKQIPCKPSRGGALTKTACKSEVIFTASGPKVRFCTAKGKPGPVVAVTSPKHATELGRAFCACVKKKGKTAKACAVEIGGSTLGRYGRSRRRA